MKTSPAAVVDLTTFIGMQVLPLSEDVFLWAALFGILAVIAMTSRFSSTPLALLAILSFVLATTWHAVTWRHDLVLSGVSPVDAAFDLAGRLWSDPNDGILGWVLDVIFFGSVFKAYAF